jgi:hypothetical protein
MRRTALAEVEGYDPGPIAGEEPELCRRLRARGYSIVHIDALMTRHDLNMTRFSQYWRRAVRAAYAYSEVSNGFRESADPMWLQESRGNVRSGGFWTAWFAVTPILLAFRSIWVLPWFALLIALPARSAWKARSRPGPIELLMLYGVHSQLQQVPILVGQLRYFRDRHSGKQRTQIEYKEEASA